MTINEQLLTELVTDTTALRADILENSAPAFHTLADQGADLAALGPIADDLETNASNIAKIQSALTDAARAVTSAQQAADAAAEATANSGVNPIMANAIRNSYSIAGRAPSVIADPVDGVYFSTNGACDFENLFDYSRNSTASFIGGNGHIQSAGSDTPRTENHAFKDGIWQRGGIRLDVETTNLFKYSDDVSNATWTRGSVTFSSDTAPDGQTTAQSVTGVSGAASYIGQATTVTAGFNTFSIYAKAGAANTICLRPYNFDATGDRAWFDLSAGTVLTKMSGLHSARIEPVGEGWFRCSVTFETTTNLSGTPYVYLSDGDNTLGNSGGNVLLWGAQIEKSSTPTSYIVTDSTSGTRSKDTLSIASENIPSSREGLTFVFEGLIDHVDMNYGERVRWVHWTKSGTSNALGAYLYDSHSLTSRIEAKYSTGVAKTSFSNSDALGQGIAIPFKIAARYSATEVQNIVNGVPSAPAQNTTGMPDMDGADISQFLKNFTGTLSRFRIFDTALPEAALIAETTL